jgi:hypothetical protein
MTDEYNSADCKNDECNICINSRILKMIHDNPHDDDDIISKRVAVRKQRDELQKQHLVWVTCPCGKKIALKMAFRCWFCGITFCDTCAKEHFGEKPLLATAAHERKIINSN